jgi:probable addiction module antidote protein
MRRDTASLRRDQLRDPEFLETYLQDRLRQGPEAFRAALREAVLSQAGGVAGFARRTGMARSGLYKALSANGNPSYRTVCQVLDALGMRPVISHKAARHALNGKTMKQETTRDQVDNAQHDKNAEQIAQQPRRESGKRILPGSGKGIFVMADDFDAPLPEFTDYV